MINQQRLTDEFARLASITSPPLREGKIARYLAERLAALGAEVLFDQAAAATTGGEVGNLVITSYSIHYTKLYDMPANAVLSPCGRILRWGGA